ncbi:GNAT family N-acetyltransferase [Stutzerimonas stutzeri]|uniref:GNAT family N-acetyltransferase n=1 Tax=Stutzerimonas stutzeri subgroup TaxID=578833 RepID=UPI00371ADF2C
MEIHIKQAGLPDIQGVSTLFDAYRIFYDQPSDLSLATAFITDRLKNSESVIFCAQTTDGQYAGFTQLYPTFSSVSAQRSWILNDLYVAEQARGLGVGKALLDQAKTHAIATNSKGLALETGKSNVTAQRLYESVGYVKEIDAYSYFLNVNKA